MDDASKGWLRFIQPNQWYTLDSLSRRSGVPRSTVRHWLVEQRIARQPSFHKTLRYRGSDILRAFGEPVEPVADERAALVAAK